MTQVNYINRAFLKFGNNGENMSLQSDTTDLREKESFRNIYKTVFNGSQHTNTNEYRRINNSNLLVTGSDNFIKTSIINTNSLEGNINNLKAQEKYNLDMKRIANLMGIGPKTLLSIVGKLNIDPQNLNFTVGNKIDDAVNSVSQYFGISPMTMLAVFEKLGIDKTDLVKEKETGKIICRLKDFFGLGIEQEKELTDILKDHIEKDA